MYTPLVTIAPTPDTVTTPLCPRCGYDFSGTAAAWNDTCPLHGICSECGLELEWRDVLNPNRAVPQWFFEHTTTRRVRRLFQTLMRVLRPARFWTVIRLHYHVRFSRLMVAVAVCVLGLQLAAFVNLLWMSRAAGTVAPPAWMVFGPRSRAAMIAVASIWPYGERASMSDRTIGGTPWLTVSVGMYALMPVAFLVLPQTLRRASVRYSHVIRIAAYSMAGLPVITLLTMAGSFFSNPAGTRWWWSGGLRIYDLLFPLGAIMPIATVAWLSVYWSAACRRYLKLPHCYGIIAATMLIALLASILTVALWDDRLRDNDVVYSLFW